MVQRSGGAPGSRFGLLLFLLLGLVGFHVPAETLSIVLQPETTQTVVVTVTEPDTWESDSLGVIGDVEAEVLALVADITSWMVLPDYRNVSVNAGPHQADPPLYRYTILFQRRVPGQTTTSTETHLVPAVIMEFSPSEDPQAAVADAAAVDESAEAHAMLDADAAAAAGAPPPPPPGAAPGAPAGVELAAAQTELAVSTEVLARAESAAGPAAGDPVLVYTGEWITAATDLELPSRDPAVVVQDLSPVGWTLAQAEPLLAFRRSYRSGRERAGWLGPGWWCLLDSRLVRGTSPGAAEALAELDALAGQIAAERVALGTYRESLRASTESAEVAASDYLALAEPALSDLDALISEYENPAWPPGTTAEQRQHARPQLDAASAQLRQQRSQLEAEIARAQELLEWAEQTWTNALAAVVAREAELSLLEAELAAARARTADDVGASAEASAWNRQLPETSWLPQMEGVGVDFAVILLPDGRPRVIPATALVALGGGLTRWDDGAGRSYTFDHRGLPAAISDSGGGTVWLTWGDSPAGPIPLSLHDSFGRELAFTTRDGRLRSVSGPPPDDTGIPVSVHYDYTPEAWLSGVTDPLGLRTGFAVEDGRVVGITKPDGSVVRIHYDDANPPRVIATVDEAGVREEFSYGPGSGERAHRSYGGTQTRWRFDGDGQPEETLLHDGCRIAQRRVAAGPSWPPGSLMQEELHRWPDGRALDVVVIRDAAGRMLWQSRTAEDGEPRIWQWHYSGAALQRVEGPAGAVSTFESDAAGRLSGIIWPDGSTERFSYSTAGLLSTWQSRHGGLHSYTWTAGGRLSSRTDPGAGGTWRWERDSWDRIVAEISPWGGRTTAERDALGRARSTVFPDASRELRDYSLRGDLIRVTDRRGFVHTREYDARRLLTRLTDGDGNVMEHRWDEGGRSTGYRMLDSAGTVHREVRLDWSEGGLSCVQTVPGTGREHRFTLDSAGRVLSERDGLGHTRLYRYNGHGELTERTWPGSGAQVLSEHSEWDASGALVALTDAAGFRWSIGRDPLGRPIALSEPGSAAPIERWSWTAGLPTSHWHAAGGLREWRYDNGGELTEERHAGRLVYSVSPGPGGLPVRDWRNGLQREFTRNAEGAVIRLCTSWSGGPSGAPGAVEEAFSWSAGLVTGWERAGAAWEFSYDSAGRVIARQDPTGILTRFTRAPDGQVLVTGQLGSRGTLSLAEVRAFDPAGELISVTAPGGGRTELRRDAAGRVVELVDPEGRRVQLAYNAEGETVEVIDAAGERWRTVRDARGFVTESHGPLGSVFRRSYTPAGRLHSEQDANGNQTRYRYDAGGRLVEQSDSLGTMRVQWSDTGLPLREDHGARGAWTWSWDASGRLAELGGPGGSILFTRDGLGRVVQSTDPFGQITRYHYGSDGLPSVIDLPDGRTQEFQRDAVGRISAVTDSHFGAVQITLDGLGREVSMMLPGGAEWRTAWDDAGRISARVLWDGTNAFATPLWGEAMIYNAAGQQTLRVLSDGSYQRFTYDAAGRLQRVELPWTQDTVATGLYHFQEAGLISPMSGPTDARPLPGGLAWMPLDSPEPGLRDDLSVAWTALGGGRLRHPQWGTGARWAEEYRYDAAGRRSELASAWGRIGYAYSPADELLQAGARTYAYDARGNRVSESGPEGGRSYHWNGRNRLAALEAPASPGGSVMATYTRDPLGRVVQAGMRSEDARGGIAVGSYRYTYAATQLHPLAVTAVPETGLLRPIRPPGSRFAYQPEPSAGLHGEPIPPQSAASRGGDLPFPVLLGESRYFRIAGVPIALDDGSGSAIIAADIRDSILGLFHAGGAPAGSGAGWSLLPGVWGESMPADRQAPGLAPPPAAPALAGSRDPVSGLVQLGYRTYDPLGASFLSRDPARAGSNWYRYADNDPLNRIDPLGLDSLHASFNREQETMTIFEFAETGSGTFTGQVTVTVVPATNNVAAPRNGTAPVPFSWGPSAQGREDAYFVPQPFPGGLYNITGTFRDHPSMGTGIMTDAQTTHPAYFRDEDDPSQYRLSTTGDTVTGGGLYQHSGTSRIEDDTWGCIRSLEDGSRFVAEAVDNVRETGGTATIYVPMAPRHELPQVISGAPEPSGGDSSVN